MGMVVQHNISAQNANNALTRNVSGLAKSTEKLSTGYQINRSADNAAGLAISEKMRSQIRGLSQATNNANDAISLIQMAEGGLQESEDILQRMRELSVQSSNGTYTDEDREQIQYEVDALKSEVDRIANSTEFNTMKLLDGSLDGGTGASTSYGPRYGSVVSEAEGIGDIVAGSSVVSSEDNVVVKFTTGASGKGGENAQWDEAGKELTINLAEGETYKQDKINELIKGANTTKGESQNSIPDVSVKFGNGVITATQEESAFNATEGGVRSASEDTKLEGILVGENTENYADTIKLTANSYGADTRTIKLSFDVAAGKENVESDSENNYENENSFKREGTFTLHLATGTEYSENDLEKLLAKGGLDYSVQLKSGEGVEPDGDTKLYSNSSHETGDGIEVALGATEGKGVYKDLVDSTGEGLTFQIGANGVEDQRITLNIANMSSAALGVDGLNVSDRDSANEGINKVDDAIKTVSSQRAKLGAMQNRLEHTVNSLNTANENLSSAESSIRDTDMATEMTKYTKNNILQQASQSMLAQANQQPQGILQLLG